MNKEKGYWHRPCPICHNQGRLMIYAYVDYDELFFCCDECMACWSSPQDIDLKRNTFREFNIKSEYEFATTEQIINHFGKDFPYREYIN